MRCLSSYQSCWALVKSEVILRFFFAALCLWSWRRKFWKNEKKNEHMMEARIRGKVKPSVERSTELVLIQLKTFDDSFVRIVKKYIGIFTCCELARGWLKRHVVIGCWRRRSIARRRFRWLIEFERRGSRGHLTHFFFFRNSTKFLGINKISQF